MKSAAFNLAFKVHRNDLSFPEGLLKAYDEDAHQDFIEALNSLSGEQKYDVKTLEHLIQDARAHVEGAQKPSIDVHALHEEIESLEEACKEHHGSIQLLHNKNSSMKPTVVPGINSSLIGLIGAVISIILFAAAGVLGGIIALVVSLIIVALLYFQDLEKLKDEKQKIARKVERNLIEIQKIQALVDEIEKTLNEKKNLLRSEQGARQAAAPKAPPNNE